MARRDAIQRDFYFRIWPGAGAALISRGGRLLGSTCRRGEIEASTAVPATKLDGAD